MTIPFDATGKGWRGQAPREGGPGDTRLQTKVPDRYHQERSPISDERSMTIDPRVKAELGREEPLRPDATIELLDRVRERRTLRSGRSTTPARRSRGDRGSARTAIQLR